MIGADWSTPRFDLPPLAPDVSVFPHREFLAAWWRLRSRPGDEVLLVEHDGGLLPAMCGADGTIGFLGEADLTDYHSPLGGDVSALLGELAAAFPAAPFSFDSLPEPAATAIAEGLSAAGADVSVAEHEVAAVLDLPATVDGYLDAIGKKERHEMRRKRRRFGEALGEPKLRRVAGGDAVARFAAMHSRAPGDKGRFFTPEMVEFFTALEDGAGAVIDVLGGDGDTPMAAAFGFEDADTYYLYNSAYDPSVGEASPGVVLTGMLIEQAISSGRSRFDFLKGAETYKFRLGAAPRPLYAVTGSFGRR